MGFEVLSTGEQLTTSGRPALLRIQPSAGTADVDTLVADAVEAGFDGVELALRSVADRPTGDQATARATLSGRTAGRELSIGALAASCRTTDVEAAVPAVLVLLQEAAAMGARSLNLSIPPIREEAGADGFPSYQHGLNFTYGLLRHVRLDAESVGVVIALESACGCCLLSPVELREIIDGVNSWAVGACIDVQRVATFSSPVDWIRTLKRRVHAVRVSEPRAEGGGHSDGAGTAFDPPAIAEALDSIGYVGALIASTSGRPGEGRSLLAKLGCPTVDQAGKRD